ncbi:MAG: magnesium transporter [Candidatus Dormibacteria bacterium]
MIFLSDFLRAEIVDNRQQPVGRLGDLAVQVMEPFPVVHQVVLRGRAKLSFPWAQVRSFEDKELVLKCSREELALHPVPESDLLLARDVLDKQIVDTDGHRVVRVNDLQLSAMAASLLVVGVDIGGRGLLRRLGVEEMVRVMARATHQEFPHKLIAWDTVDPVHSGNDSVKLRISHHKLARMHPADIAEVVNQLSAHDRQAVFASLDDETAAEALQEMDAEDQAEIFQRLDDERAADILEEMSPDEAADLLDDLPQERQRVLLDKMDDEDAEDVEELLSYEEDTAGGLMTTEYVTVTTDLTAAEAIERLRELEPEAESVYYVYAVDHHENLLGVLSLRDLIVARPETPVADFMISKVVSVPLDASHAEVAEVIRKYNLLAVPVTDVDMHLEGIVTVDDVMDSMLRGGGFRARLARVFG